MALLAGMVLFGGRAPQTAPAKLTAGSYKRVAYFTQWGIYVNTYYPKNLVTSGVAANLDYLMYAFENIDPVNLTCFEANHASNPDPGGENDPNAGDGAGDSYADYQKSYDSSISVDGTSDTFNMPIVGNFHQLQELKLKYPNMKIILSLGGWTYSKYFSDVAATAAARTKFVSSCIDMFIKGNLPSQGGYGGPGTAAGIFDGFDLDWEYPGILGHLGNHISPNDGANFTLLAQEFRTQLNALGGKHYYLTAALPSGHDKISLIQPGALGGILDFGDLLSYDMHGAWEMTTNFAAPLHESPNDPSPTVSRYTIDAAVNLYQTAGYPAAKMNLGLPFYFRGWTGVPAGPNHGLYQTASGPSPQFPFTQVPGTAAYKELQAAGEFSNRFYDPITQQMWLYDGTNFYSGDDPSTLATKVQYMKCHGYGGTMVWSLEQEPTGTLWGDIANDLATGPATCPSGSPPPTPTATPVVGPPGPPTGAMATANGGGQATVTWTPPANNGGGTVNFYAIYSYCTNGQTAESVVGGTSTVQSGLPTNTYCTFTLTAWNGSFWGGWSGWSNWAFIT